MRILLAILISTIAIPSLSAQTKSKIDVTIKGQVLDSLTNESLAYANIRITEKATPKIVLKVAAADQNGKFEIKLNKSGSYIIAFQYLGKNEDPRPLEITGEEKTIDLGKILLRDQNGLEEVVVTAFKPLVIVDLDKITYNTEDDPDSKTNSVFDMMRKVPMITIDAEDKIELKGLSSYKIYLDGKPSNMITNNPTQVLKSMPANTVKTIEVITDPGAKYDAEGVNGIINIVTNKQPFGGYTASLNAGLDSRGGYNAGAYLSAKYKKIGFTGNYNYYDYKNPASNSSSSRESLDNSYFKYFNQNGSSSYSGHGQHGSAEISYEIDTLNLITFSANGYQGKGTPQNNLNVTANQADHSLIYAYNQNTESEYTYGNTSLNADYQRTFRKKDELLTASYRYSISPDDSRSDTEIESVFNYQNRDQRSYSNADTKEHTFQLDYTTPLAKIHTIEAGVKYIIRINESLSQHDTLDIASNNWIPINTVNDQFKHRQDIFSGYAGYSLKLKKLGFKAGLRLESTDLNAEFPLNTAQNFGADYFNFIPSGTVSYKLKETQNLRFGYNMRIQRPGIWYLNPYIDNSDPKNISFGNPELDVEKSHNLNLNYSYFNPNLNLNANLYYNFMNNSIQRVSWMENDTIFTSYANIGKRNDVGLNIYGNWNPTKKLRLNLNAYGSYVDIRANNDMNLANSGFVGRIFAGIQYNFPLDFVLSLNGGFSSPSINLQGTYSGYHYSSIGINKSFLNKKLTLSLSGSNIFEKYITRKNEYQTPQFRTYSENQFEARAIRFSVSFRFGEMKQGIQKTRRSISNDDTKQGESSSSNSGGDGK